MKILHLSTDDKFFHMAYEVFEVVFPDCNEAIFFSNKDKINDKSTKISKVVNYRVSQLRRPKVKKEKYAKYDLVVFHSFGNLLYPEVFNIPEGVPTVWLGWGYDYYDLIDTPQNLLLPETKKVSTQIYKSLIRSAFGKAVRVSLKLVGVSKSKEKAIERLSFFSPVLPNEYDMVLKSRNWHSFPEQVRWNYGTIEDHFIKGFEGEQVDGNSILVGNSASLTCNHKETFDFLINSSFEKRKIIAPLSYGDTIYGEKIEALGNNYFSSDFYPLKKFMPIQEYVATIKQCGYVVMNHKRQQAVGSIVIMLYLGARVFLREENPTFTFLKDLGVNISSVQKLEEDVSLLDKPLSQEEKERNMRLVMEYWSRETGIARTKALVDRALSHANKCGRMPRGSL